MCVLVALAGEEVPHALVDRPDDPGGPIPVREAVVAELVVEPGNWRTMQGRAPEEQLIIRPAGPLLSTARAGWVVVTGWRDLPDQPGPMWTVVMVRQAAITDAD